MPRYLIGRELEGAGKLSEQELHAISAKSNGVLREMRSEGKDIQWVESYVTDNAINCVYVAAEPALIEEHAARGGFPCTNLQQVREVIDPTTGE